MSDQFSSFTVHLAKDISEKQARAVMQALLLLSGVIAVDVNQSDSFAEWTGIHRERERWRKGVEGLAWPGDGK